MNRRDSYNIARYVPAGSQERGNPRRKVSRVSARDGRGFIAEWLDSMRQYAHRRLRDSGIDSNQQVGEVTV